MDVGRTAENRAYVEAIVSRRSYEFNETKSWVTENLGDSATRERSDSEHVAEMTTAREVYDKMLSAHMVTP